MQADQFGGDEQEDIVTVSKRIVNHIDQMAEKGEKFTR